MASAPDTIGINALAYYIKRINKFLESEKKTLSFPNISPELHNALVRISTQNMEFLNGDEYSDNVKMEAANLAASIKTHAKIKLSHDICDGKFGANVLTYKKIDVNPFKVPENVALRQPSVLTSLSTIIAPADGSVTQVFKTRCLNAATNFVKDDSQLVMRFPEMVPAQAEFVMDILQPGKDGSENTDVGFGFRSMYAPLWESMKLFSLKYSYKIEYDTRPVSKEGMKRIVFEKVPKTRHKAIETCVAVDNTPEIVIIDSDDEDTNADVHSAPSTSQKTTKADTGQQVEKQEERKLAPLSQQSTKRSDKLIKKLREQMATGEIVDNFIHDALKRVAEFLMNDKQKSIEFDRMTLYQQHFLANVVRVSVYTDTYMLFTYDCQRWLDDIKYCWNVKRVRYQVLYETGLAKGIGHKNIVFEKISPKIPGLMDLEVPEPLITSLSSKSTTSFTTNNSAEQQPTKTRLQLTTIFKRGISKLEKTTIQLKERLQHNILPEEFVKTTLERIWIFMEDQKQASLVMYPENFDQSLFIQQVCYYARESSLYSLFSDECRMLLGRILVCWKRNVVFHVRQFKKRKDVLLEKQARFNNRPVQQNSIDKDMSLQKPASIVKQPVKQNGSGIDMSLQKPAPIVKQPVKQNGSDIDVSLQKPTPIVKQPIKQIGSDTDVSLQKPTPIVKQPIKQNGSGIGSLLSVSTSSISTDRSVSSNSQKSSKKQKKAQVKARRTLQVIYVKIMRGSFRVDVNKILNDICDFLYNDEQRSITFEDLSTDSYQFITVVGALARDESKHSAFTEHGRKLLADLNRCFKGNMEYTVDKVKGADGKVLVLTKKGLFSTKDLMKERESNENVNNTNIVSSQPKQTTLLTQPEQERLIRLKAIKDTVAHTCGEQAIMDYLQDISNFLTHSNMDRTLTFDEMSEDEALFIKYMNLMSKTEAAYAMFPRDAQKLLSTIQSSARSYRLTCQTKIDGNNKWTVSIEKQAITIKERAVGLERARSLSAGPRAANAHIRPMPRDSSLRNMKPIEKLKAGLAQPVHSDKALRMMESMGWRGGALGLRGEGIVEPIALPLELSKRAGFGHVPGKKLKPEKVKGSKKQKASKQEASKQVASKQEATNQKAPKQNTLKTNKELPTGFQPLSALAADTVPPGILPKGLLEKCKTVVLNDNSYRVVLLRSILEMVTTDFNEIHFTTNKSPAKVMGFLQHLVSSFNGRRRCVIQEDVMMELVLKISRIFAGSPALLLNAEIRNETDLYPHVAVLRKIKLTPTLPPNPNEVISLIDDDEEDDHNTNIDDKDTTKIWYIFKDIPEQTVTKSWYEITQTEHSRLWYLPLQKQQQQKTIENQVPELKQIALSAVCKMGNLDVEMATMTDQNTTLINNQVTMSNDHITTNDQNMIITVDEGSSNEAQISCMWYQISESDCQWNFPVESKRKHHKEDAIKHKIPKLKNLALSAVCKEENIDTNVEITTRNDKILTVNGQDIANSNGRRIITEDGKILTVPNDLKTAISYDQLTITTNDQHGQITILNDQNTTSKDQNMDSRLEPIRKSKMVLKIPNMTRKRFSLTNQNTEIVRPQRTTYALEIEKYRANKKILTNVKVSKNLPESCTDRKRMKISIDQQETTNIQIQQDATANIGDQQQLSTDTHLQRNTGTTILKKLPGELLLEKLTINNNDSMINKNTSADDKKQKNKAKNVMVNKENEVVNSNTPKINTMGNVTLNNEDESMNSNTPKINDISNDTVNKENKSINSNTPKIHGISNNTVNKNNESIDGTTSTLNKYPIMKDLISNVTINKENELSDSSETKNNSSSKMNDIAPAVNSVAPNKSDNTLTDLEAELICKKTADMKITDSITIQNNDINLNDSEYVTYIIPVECKIIVEDNITESLHVTKENKNLEDKCNATIETGSLSKSDTNNEDNTSLNDDISLLNDDEIDELANILNSVVTDENVSENDSIRKLLKAKHTSRNDSPEVENEITETGYDADNDYDSIDTVIEVYSERNENLTESQSKIIERKRLSVDYPTSTPKKCKLLTDFKKIYIIPKNYPDTQMDTEKSREIQSAILKSIDYTQESMPLLKCHGIQNGGLIYSCQDEKSLFFLENLIHQIDDLKVVYEFDVKEQLIYKMAFRINSYIDEPVSNILNRFELYNSELNSSKWGVVKKEQHGDFTVIYVEVDESSFNYICAVNFLLYAGNDCARFTILWD